MTTPSSFMVTCSCASELQKEFIRRSLVILLCCWYRIINAITKKLIYFAMGRCSCSLNSEFTYGEGRRQNSHIEFNKPNGREGILSWNRELVGAVCLIQEPKEISK